jgi:hypothetical protein
MVDDPSHFSDVECSLCGRHNQHVRVVATSAGPIVCQVCVAACAEIFDQEVGLTPPLGGWARRWPLKS